jgi:TonB dependent receptor
VNVLTGTYSAQFGNSTNGIISVQTKSGTQTTHGDYFAYLRPSGTQAEPLLATFHIPNQKLDWGASQGGPLLNKSTRYFASYERVQVDRGAVITSPTPDFFDGRSNQYSGLLKLDHDLNAGNVLTLRVNGDHYATNNADDRVAGISNPTYGRTAKVQSWGGQIADQAVIGKAVNIARFSFTAYVPDSATPLSTSSAIVVPNYLQEGYSTYSWVHGNSEQMADVYALVHRWQSIKLGGELEILRVKDYSYSPLGTYSYHTAADFMNQNPYQYAQTYGTAYIRYGQQAFNVFVQDDVKLRPNLTFNVGLRYEFQSITSSGRNFGPRLGLAWDVNGDGRTVVRAGSGIYFDQYYMYLNRRFITLGPNSPQFNYTWNCTLIPDPCPTYPNAVQSPSGGVSSPFVSYLYIPGNKLLNPYALQFSLAVQHQLATNTVLTLSGLNVHTLKQMRVYDINHPAPFLRTGPGQVRSVAAANAARPFSAYDGDNNVTLVDQIVNTGSSLYQSFDAAVAQRFGRWGEVNGHYVYAGSYTYSMFYADYNSGVPSEWLPDYDRYERGPSDFYQRHRFIADSVLHGWYKTTLALVGTFGSGLPVNHITGVDNNGDGYTVDRPVRLGRNSFFAPAQRTMDVSLARQFTLHDRLGLDLRAQAFNVLNSRNLIVVNNSYGNGAAPIASFLAPEAGITNSDPSRQLEGVTRIRF